jgi:hypothetical protein
MCYSTRYSYAVRPHACPSSLPFRREYDIITNNTLSVQTNQDENTKHPNTEYLNT